MKVILLQDVKSQGKKDQIIEASDGYARNYLIPRKLAKEATAEAINSIEKSKSADKHREAVKKAEAEAKLAELEAQIAELTAGKTEAESKLAEVAALLTATEAAAEEAPAEEAPAAPVAP